MMRRMFFSLVDGWFRRATLLVLVLSGAGCSDVTGPGPLDDARALWLEAGATSYSYELQPLCFCGFTNNSRVTVSNGVVTSVFDLEEQRFLEDTQTQLYVPVERLFDILEEALAQDVHSLEVEYDPSLGFPTEFFIDYEENTVDEELGYRAGRLTID
jgi:Family of unknown function (DUF6174)